MIDRDQGLRPESSAELNHAKEMESQRLHDQEEQGELEVHHLLLNHAHHLPGVNEIEGDITPPAQVEARLSDEDGDVHHLHLAEKIHVSADVEGTGADRDLDLFHHPPNHAGTIIADVLTLSGRAIDEMQTTHA